MCRVNVAYEERIVTLCRKTFRLSKNFVSESKYEHIILPCNAYRVMRGIQARGNIEL